MPCTAAQTPVAEPADICRKAPDRRQYKRVPLEISRRFMMSNQDELSYKLIDVSVGSAAIATTGAVEIGDQIIFYFDHLGGLEGQAIRPMGNGFAIRFNATQAPATSPSIARPLEPTHHSKYCQPQTT